MAEEDPESLVAAEEAAELEGVSMPVIIETPEAIPVIVVTPETTIPVNEPVGRGISNDVPEISMMAESDGPGSSVNPGPVSAGMPSRCSWFGLRY